MTEQRSKSPEEMVAMAGILVIVFAAAIFQDITRTSPSFALWFNQVREGVGKLLGQ